MDDRQSIRSVLADVTRRRVARPMVAAAAADGAPPRDPHRAQVARSRSRRPLALGREALRAAEMIVSLHVATGAVAGVAARSRGRAVVLGALAHFLGDRVPHYDVGDRRFEIWSGAAALAAIAVRRGPFDPATIGAAAGSAPDLEHVMRLPRPGGRKLFPSHRIRGWHRSGGLSTSTQVLAAGILLGLVLAPRRRDDSRPPL